tara:strand:- start:47 stop:1075 length:1029 start_codon:yes stop_codon:yes gene_type:complete
MDDEYANLDKYGKGILQLTDNKPDNLFRQQTVLAIMEYCSNNNEWIPLLNWADKIDKQHLSKEAFATTTDAGKNITIKSKLESWYTKKSKALEKCMEWQKCLEVCDEALKEFPDEIWFHYRKAKATWHLGNPESALTLFKSILNRKKEWFIYKDIASIHAELNDNSKAKKNIIEGCIVSQRIPNREYRWELYYDAAIYFHKTSNNEMAIRYLQLALALRIENDWKVPDKVTQFANELNVDMDQKIKSDILFNELKESWKEEKYSDLEKQKGEIKSILPNGKAGFIRSNTTPKDYFFRLSSYSGNKAEVVPKLNVEFYIIESFDKKKNQQSEEAVEIHSIYSH